MKKIYIVDIIEEAKSGLFYAVDSRVSSENADILNIGIVDSWFIKIIKRISGKQVLKKKKDFTTRNNLYKAVNLEVGMLGYILRVFKLYGYYNSYLAKKLVKKSGHKLTDVKLIISHWGVTAGLISFKLSKEINCDFSVTYHGSDIHTIPQKNEALKKEMKQMFRQAFLNVFVSDMLLKQARAMGFSNGKSKVIHNFVDEVEFKNLICETTVERIKLDYGATENTKVIGFVGNLVDVKNAHFLPDIHRELKNLVKDFKMVVIGKGEYSDLMSKTQEVESDFIYLGEKKREELPNYLSTFDVLLLPSQNEGLPMIIIEAAICGTKVIASKVGGIPEMLRGEELVDLDEQLASSFALKVKKTLGSNECFRINKSFITGKLEPEYREYLKRKDDRAN